jgi:predicted AlkP superfamily pyrophosphatase or phosphodiesterase
MIAVMVWLVAGSASLAANTVVWISIDGLKHDYIERFHPPTLSRLAAEGAYSNEEKPIFPSLTFPNHIAQVTGTTVDHHGIVMNSFFDSATGKTYTFPDDSSLIRAEPIWITAKRQGIRVAVIDWPMSDAQQGQWKSDYFNANFDQTQTDQQRLEHVVDILKKDSGKPPLRLVISYMSHVDMSGHRYGPDDPAMAKAVLAADKTLGEFVKSVTEWFDATHSADDELYILVTTDHGMLNVRQVVSLDRLIGADLFPGVRIVTSGPIATISLDKIPADQRDDRIEKILAQLKPNTFLTAWKSEEVPAKFHYADPTRLGQIVVLLAPGYAYTSLRFSDVRAAPPGPKGMHGFDPAISPDMFGSIVLWRYRHPLDKGVDLGLIDNTQWHATVARLLGITPATGSDPRAIPFPG